MGPRGAAGLADSSDALPFAHKISDLNLDGVVNGADLTILLGSWGTNDPVADLSGDGLVGGADLTIMLGNWGDCPTP